MKDTPTIFNIAAIAAEARAAEELSAFREIRDIFYPVWGDTAKNPDLSHLEAPIQAELLRLAGYFLSQTGRADGLPGYQLRAKDALTTSSRLFKEIGNLDKYADAEVHLANCYLYEGDLETCDIILASITQQFALCHPAAVRINTNKAIALNEKGDYEGAYQHLPEIYKIIDKCPSFKAQIQFHDTAGQTLFHLGQRGRGVFHLQRAVTIAQDSGNRHLRAISLNQLAMAHKEMGEYAAAHRYAEKAYKIAEAGWAIRILDTDAQIYLAESRTEEALKQANRAVEMFFKTEDYRGWADALFTKCQIELRTCEKAAYDTYKELCDLAVLQLGEKALDRYKQAFLNELKIIRDEKEKDSCRIKCIRAGNKLAYAVPSSLRERYGLEPVVTPECPQLLIPGMLILFEYEKELCLGRFDYDADFRLYVIGDDMLSPSAIRYIGVV